MVACTFLFFALAPIAVEILHAGQNHLACLLYLQYVYISLSLVFCDHRGSSPLCEASARMLLIVVLAVDGWKYQCKVKNIRDIDLDIFHKKVTVFCCGYRLYTAACSNNK